MLVGFEMASDGWGEGSVRRVRLYVCRVVDSWIFTVEVEGDRYSASTWEGEEYEISKRVITMV